MLFSDFPRTHYQNSPLREVACQLHYPSIRSISTKGPADFQKEIQEEFPEYTCWQDPQPPSSGGHNNLPLLCHQFSSKRPKKSKKERWYVRLTQESFTLTTLDYEGWEDFAGRLDRCLAAFIRTYWPDCFLRVELQYSNTISRSRLGLKGCDWPELLAPAYTAVFQEPEAEEGRLLDTKCDIVFQLDSSCKAKIRSGLTKAPLNPEWKFLLNIDLSMEGKLDCALAPDMLQTLHGYSTPIFQGAVTDRLREAMNPL